MSQNCRKLYVAGMSQNIKVNIRVHAGIIQLMNWFIRGHIALPSSPNIIEFWFSIFNMLYGKYSKINEIQ